MSHLLYKDIAEIIETKIINDELKEGDKLLSERELANKYNVSRNVVRESIKVLREKGLVEIKIGKGAYITKPKIHLVADTLERTFKFNDIQGEDILEVREALESLIINKAVQQATSEDIAILKELYKKMEANKDRMKEFVEFDKEFHFSLAKSTQNKVFYILLNSFYSLLKTEMNKVMQYTFHVEEAQSHHKKIIRTIEKRDEKQAELAIKQHMDLFRKEIKILKEQKKL